MVGFVHSLNSGRATMVNSYFEADRPLIEEVLKSHSFPSQRGAMKKDAKEPQVQMVLNANGVMGLCPPKTG
jgi:hypothetical protein